MVGSPLPQGHIFAASSLFALVLHFLVNTTRVPFRALRRDACSVLPFGNRLSDMNLERVRVQCLFRSGLNLLEDEFQMLML